MNKELIKRVVIIALVILSVAAVWFYKKSQDDVVASMDAAVLHPDFELVSKSFEREALLKHQLPMLIVFGADTCSACRAYKPILAKMNQKMQGKAIVKFIDITDSNAAARGYPLRVIPTSFFFMPDGKAYKGSAQGPKLELYQHNEDGSEGLTMFEGRLDERQLESILASMGAKI